MYICVKCKAIMRCDKNEVGTDFGSGHVHLSDRFKCPACGLLILAANPRSVYDPEYKAADEYLRMKGNQP